MSRIYENLFSKIDFKSHNNPDGCELSENCTFLKHCCCDISSLATQFNYKDVPANGYLSLLAIVVNFDRILSNEMRQRQPKLNKYVMIARILRVMFEILMELKEDMNKQQSEDRKSCLLAVDYEVGFKGFTYTQKHSRELSVIFGTIGPFWLYKSIQKIIRKIAVGVALLHTFPKSVYFARSRKSRSINFAKCAISGKTFKLLDLCNSKLYSLYVSLHYRRSPVKSVTKVIEVETKFEISKDMNSPINVKKRNVKHSIRLKYLFNNEKLDERKDLLIHIHGGCFVKSTPDAHEIYLRDWALKLSNVPIIAVDYSKSKFPAGLQDVVDFYIWLTTNSDVQSLLGFKPNRIVLSGDSAGANIIVALTLILNDICKSNTSEDITFPAGILSIYGAFGVIPVMSPSRLLSGIDPILYQTLLLSALYYYSGTNDRIIEENKHPKKQNKLWFQREDERIKQMFSSITNVLKHPYASPLLYPSFSEMPNIPLSLISCHFCPLLDDSVELAKIWKGNVELHVFDGLPHGFLNFSQDSDEAEKASDKCVEIVKQLLYNSDQSK